MAQWEVVERKPQGLVVVVDTDLPLLVVAGDEVVERVPVDVSPALPPTRSLLSGRRGDLHFGDADPGRSSSEVVVRVVAREGHPERRVRSWSGGSSGRGTCSGSGEPSRVPGVGDRSGGGPGTDPVSRVGATTGPGGDAPRMQLQQLQILRSYLDLWVTEPDDLPHPVDRHSDVTLRLCGRTTVGPTRGAVCLDDGCVGPRVHGTAVGRYRLRFLGPGSPLRPRWVNDRV